MPCSSSAANTSASAGPPGEAGTKRASTRSDSKVRSSSPLADENRMVTGCPVTVASSTPCALESTSASSSAGETRINGSVRWRIFVEGGLALEVVDDLEEDEENGGEGGGVDEPGGEMGGVGRGDEFLGEERGEQEGKGVARKGEHGSD